MSARRKAYLLLFAAVLLGGGGYLVHGRFVDPRSDDGPDTFNGRGGLDEAVPVAIERAARGPIVHSLVSTANLRARRVVDVATRAAGIVTSLNVEEGDSVRAGQTLCSLDDRELRIELELARQRLAQTRIQLESALIRKEQTETRLANKRTVLKRNEEALSQGLLAESEVAIERHDIEDLVHEVRVVESTVRESHYRIDELESEIEKVKLQIAQTAIEAPFAGKVTERTVELGQSVRVGDALFKVGAFRPLYADVFVPENDSREARPGQRVTLRLGMGDDPVAVGQVERVSPVVDEETGTVKVTVRFDPPSDDFRPGAFVRVRIETDTREKAVLIPRQAVMEEDGQLWVTLLDGGGLARRTKVELGYQDETRIEVVTGVSEGDAVVIAGQGRLKDGDRTRVVTDYR